MRLSIEKQLPRRDVKRFQGWLVFKAHILLHHATLGSRVIKKNFRLEKNEDEEEEVRSTRPQAIWLAVEQIAMGHLPGWRNTLTAFPRSRIRLITVRMKGSKRGD